MVERALLRVCVRAAALAVVACGGGQDLPPLEAGPAPTGGEAAPAAVAPAGGPEQTDQQKAAALFTSLSDEIEKLAADKPVDPKWLSGKLMEVARLDPNHLASRYNLAVLVGRAGKADAAKQQFAAIYNRDPSFAPAAENVAADYVQQGKLGEAQAIYDKIIAKDPTNTTSRLGMARLLLTQGKHEEAIDLCRKVLQRKADAIEAFRVLARAYRSVGNGPMAQLIIGRGFKVSDQDPELHYLLAEILLEKGELAAGVSKLKEVIKMKPDWLRVRAQLAQIALQYRDFGNASQQLEAIARERADDRPTQVALAVSYRGMGRFDKAVEIYNGLLGKNPNDLDALWNIASLYDRNLVKYDEALKFYERFTAAAPEADENRKQVPGREKVIKDAMANAAANKEREEREAKRRDAIARSCELVASGKPLGAVAEDVGNEEERTNASWALLSEASQFMAAGELDKGDGTLRCALGLLPDTPSAKQQACAPMLVMWTRDVLYPLGRLEDGVKSVTEALTCDPENPDAQLIKDQLTQLLEQQKAEAAAAGAEGAPPEGGGEAPPAEGGAATP